MQHHLELDVQNDLDVIIFFQNTELTLERVIIMICNVMNLL